MFCPECHSQNLKVLEKRDAEDEISIRRRRECIDCNHRFTTYERIETPTLTVTKKDGTKELYSREKLSAGVYKALQKRPVTEPQIEALLDEIEKELRCKGSEVESTKIGDMIMEKLKKVDAVGYIRFASVYKSFDDLGSFLKEMESIEKTG